MFWTMALTRNASPPDVAAGKGETVIVAPETFACSNNQYAAIAVFGAKHAEEILADKGSPDYLVLHSRQGV